MQQSDGSFANLSPQDVSILVGTNELVARVPQQAIFPRLTGPRLPGADPWTVRNGRWGQFVIR